MPYPRQTLVASPDIFAEADVGCEEIQNSCQKKENRKTDHRDIAAPYRDHKCRRAADAENDIDSICK